FLEHETQRPSGNCGVGLHAPRGKVRIGLRKERERAPRTSDRNSLPEQVVTGLGPWTNAVSTSRASKKPYALSGSRVRRPATTWASSLSGAGCRTTGGAT